MSSYGAPLSQRASHMAQHSSLFGPDGTVNYDYIVTLSQLSLVNWLNSNGIHTNHYWANLAHASKLIKSSDRQSTCISIPVFTVHVYASLLHVSFSTGSAISFRKWTHKLLEKMLIAQQMWLWVLYKSFSTVK